MANFQVISSPALAGVASASQAAAGAGRRNVFTGFSASVYDSAGAGTIRALRLRDGASGAGAVLLDIDFINTGVFYVANGFYIIGSANTAMTLEFDANGVATELQTITLLGRTI